MAGAASIEAASAVRAGLDVVMAPEPWFYFDWAYADDPREPPAIRAAMSVERVYGLEPLPTGLEARTATGFSARSASCGPSTSATLATPSTCTSRGRAPSPKWSGRQDREWGEFQPRLSEHLTRLDALGVNYRPLEGPKPGQAATWPA